MMSKALTSGTRSNLNFKVVIGHLLELLNFVVLISFSVVLKYNNENYI
jgi:hypothetical protein